MRGFKKFSRKEVSSDIIPEARNQVQTGYVSGNSHQKDFLLFGRKRLFIISGALFLLIIFGVGVALVFNQKNSSKKEPDIVKLSGLSQEKINNPGSLTSTENVKLNQATLEYWKQKGDCTQQESAALIAADNISNSNKQEAIKILKDVISICNDSKMAKEYLKSYESSE